MAKGHRSQIKKERNEIKDTRPKAYLKFARLSDTKARIVLEQIKGKDVGTAIAILSYSPRYAAELILKVLKSAIANADHEKMMKNLDINTDKLYVEEVFADQGPTMKRIHPRAQGRAYRINKKMSHISIILNER